MGGSAGKDQNAALRKVARAAVVVGLIAFVLLFWAAVVWAVSAL
jgi:uncharacterized membrane protein